MQVRKQQLEPDIEQWTCSKLGKEYVKAAYCPPVYLIYAEYIMRNTRLNEAQAGIKIAGRNANKLKYGDTILMAKKQRGAKKPLVESIRGE